MLPVDPAAVQALADKLAERELDGEDYALYFGDAADMVDVVLVDELDDGADGCDWWNAPNALALVQYVESRQQDLWEKFHRRAETILLARMHRPPASRVVAQPVTTLLPRWRPRARGQRVRIGRRARRVPARPGDDPDPALTGACAPCGVPA